MLEDAWRIVLTTSEMLIGAQAGVLRQVQNIQKNRTPAHGHDDSNPWQLHIEGVLGEMAVAKALNLYWYGSIGNLGASDVGSLQVRTRSKHWHNLIIHPSDPDDSIFVAVTGANGTYVLRGWLRGAEGKNEKYWLDPGTGRPAYFVPDEALHPMDTLRVVEVAG